VPCEARSPLRVIAFAAGRHERRSVEHRDGLLPGFTKKYGVKQLVYFEMFDGILGAIQREKSLKRWPREWKTNDARRGPPSLP
jgi:putative endonuclease